MPKILLLASGEWMGTARLALDLRAMGCEVELVCAAKHPVMNARVPFRRHAYSPLRPLASLRRAIEISAPGLLIPADELMLLHVEELWQGSVEASALRTLIERSLGGATAMAAGRSRIALLDAAKAQHVAAPETVVIDSDAAMAAAIEQMGLPLVLKADSTSGGRGIRVIQNAGEARRAWRLLRGPTSLARAAKRAVVSREFTHLRPWMQRELRGVTAQCFVTGAEHTVMAVCHEGRVLSTVCMQVLNTWCERGPSSVVRAEHDPAMEAAVTRIAGELRLSGFCGFDFIASEKDGRRLLIEMNPRPTQLMHLPFGPGRDLVAAYVREFCGTALEDRPTPAPSGLVAIFPLEIQRDAKSFMLTEAHHDVPWSEPALVRSALGTIPASIRNHPRWREEGGALSAGEPFRQASESRA